MTDTAANGGGRVDRDEACGSAQRFEARLTAGLSDRRPDLVGEVVACDDGRGWLLLADAGARVGIRPEANDALLRLLPAYAELQRGEAPLADEHVTHGVPDLRLAVLPDRYAALTVGELPLKSDEQERLRSFAPRFGELCATLAAFAIPESVQHDDLHGNNLFADGESVRLLDWGDASIAHPFFSLVVPYRFLDEVDGLPPSDPWFAQLRDAYLEPWGAESDAFGLALRVGAFAHAIAWLRQRDALPPADRPAFDEWFAVVLRRALARIEG
jgi:hypothetical protein